MPTPEQLAQDLVNHLSSQDKDRILCNLIWELFGEEDDHGNARLNPRHTITAEQVRGAISGFRSEFF